MFFALAFFDFFMPGLNTESANSAITHTRIAPTVAVENGSNAKPTITTTLRTHFATNQPCLAKPHEVRTLYSTAVAIRNGMHGTMNCERNASMATIVAICDGLGLEEETAQNDVSPNDMTAVEHVYLARIDDLKKSMAQKDRWIKGLFAICLSMVIIMVTLLAVDLLVPTVGWFRG